MIEEVSEVLLAFETQGSSILPFLYIRFARRDAQSYRCSIQPRSRVKMSDQLSSPLCNLEAGCRRRKLFGVTHKVGPAAFVQGLVLREVDFPSLTSDCFKAKSADRVVRGSRKILAPHELSPLLEWHNAAYSPSVDIAR